LKGMFNQWLGRWDDGGELISKTRNEARKYASGSCPSEEEKAGSKSILASITFRDGLRYSGLARPRWTIEPDDPTFIVPNPSYDLCDYVLASSSMTSGHRPGTVCTTVPGVIDRIE
jgi:hypothetical protein